MIRIQYWSLVAGLAVALGCGGVRDGVDAPSEETTPAPAPAPTEEVRLEGQPNFRDLGGYETADGRRIRSGEFYRSGELALVPERRSEDPEEAAASLASLATRLLEEEVEVEHLVFSHSGGSSDPELLWAWAE